LRIDPDKQKTGFFGTGKHFAIDSYEESVGYHSFTRWGIAASILAAPQTLTVRANPAKRKVFLISSGFSGQKS
jgi:hypothetical protein